eukprot:1372819-Rhodomonas_salina.2
MFKRKEEKPTNTQLIQDMIWKKKEAKSTNTEMMTAAVLGGAGKTLGKKLGEVPAVIIPVLLKMAKELMSNNS